MTVTKAKPVSASEVREHFKAKPALLEGKGKLWKNVKSRGVLNKELISIYNADKRSKAKYVVGEGTAVKRITIVGPKGRKFSVATSELRVLDGSTGNRGRISLETKAKYVAQVLANEAAAKTA